MQVTHFVLQKGVNALAPGGRIALLELQIPEKWPSWMVNIGVWLMKPFAVTDEWLERRPWESIQKSLREQLDDVSMTTMYLGLTYIIAGSKS